VFPALRARSLLIPLRRLAQSPRRTIAVMDLAAGTHVLVIGVESETRLGHAALHRLLNYKTKSQVSNLSSHGGGIRHGRKPELAGR
jgi:hypothetical protein